MCTYRTKNIFVNKPKFTGSILRGADAIVRFDQTEYLAEGVIKLYMLVSPYLCADSNRESSNQNTQIVNWI